MPKVKSRKQAEPKAPEGQPAGAGRQPAVNKTEAIRALLEECTRAGRDTAPKALVEELKRQHPSEVWTIAYVSSIKSKLKRKQHRQAPASPLGPPAGEAGLAPAGDPVALVLAVKSLAKQAGGLHRLKQLIEALQSDG
jgi:hypothetical protein